MERSKMRSRYEARLRILANHVYVAQAMADELGIQGAAEDLMNIGDHLLKLMWESTEGNRGGPAVERFPSDLF